MNWGILATGTIAAKFAKTINAMGDEARLMAVASRSQQKASAFAEEYGIPNAHGSYEALYQDPQVEIVYVATPNNMHFQNVMDCLENGKHVLCEKPFTTNRKEAEALFRKAEERGLFVMEAFWIKFLPLLQKLEDVISQGVIGEVQHVRADFGFIATGARKDRKFNSALAGGALLDVGIYNLGFAKMILKDRPVSFHSSVTINDYGTDEFSTTLLEYPGKRTAVLTAAIGMEMPVEGAIFGTKGRIFLPHYQMAEKMTVKVYGEDAYTVEMPFAINGFEYQIREAQNSIKQGKTSSDQFPPAHTLEIMELMDQIRQSWGLKYPCEQ